jgi:hypothetical protein
LTGGWQRTRHRAAPRGSSGAIACTWREELIAAVLIAFFILHVLGGTILQRPSSQKDTFDVVLNRAID